jgi:hypothetical protein
LDFIRDKRLSAAAKGATSEYLKAPTDSMTKPGLFPQFDNSSVKAGQRLGW